MQSLYRCCSNYALSKLIVENGLKNLWRRENSDSSDTSSGARSSIGKVYTDIKIPKKPRLIKQWYPLLIIIILFLLTGSPLELKMEKRNSALITLFYVSPNSPQQ